LNYLFRTKQNAEAESLLKLAIENDPTNHTLYLAAGSTYESLNRMDEAIAAYKKAIEIKPEAWQAYYNLGAYYNNEGKKLQDAANNEKDNKKYEAGIKAADAQLAIALEYLEKAKELTEKGSEDRMDILKALKQLYVRMNLTEKFEAIKKEMQP
jgi:tetratricopeptide (TPR) repeat protein